MSTLMEIEQAAEKLTADEQKQLLRFLLRVISKSDYFLLARAMKPEELPREVRDKLTSIQFVVAP